MESHFKHGDMESQHIDDVNKFRIDSKLITFSDERHANFLRGTWEGVAVVIKTTKIPDSDPRWSREVLLGRILSHPNISNIHGWYRDERQDKLKVVMPLCESGTLEDLLQRSSATAPCPDQGGPLGWCKFFDICVGILRALRYMAACIPNPVIHRNLKPSNILMMNDKPQLCDFGLATNSLHATTATGTPAYMALERLEGNIAQTPAADIYSFGCLAWEMLHAPRKPRDHCGTLRMMEEVEQGKPLDMSAVPEQLQFLEDCFNSDPLKRPTAAQLLTTMMNLQSEPFWTP